MQASAAPAAMAGRASGRLTRKNACHAGSPSVRPASASDGDCSRKATRASRYTYGYRTATNIAAAPGSERISGNQ